IQSNYPLKRVEMIDLTGKMIKTENLNSQKEYKIQTKNYPNGLIFINVYNEKNEMRSFQIRN
ncbi:MAG: T9SS type A sorting domain-containing protein, partial [Saprospiraceae bacterium]